MCGGDFHKYWGDMRRLLLFSMILVGCSEHGGFPGSLDTSVFSQDSEVSDILDVVDVVDVITDADIGQDTGPSYESKCHETWYLFCPPMNGMWKQEVVVDRCDGNKIVSQGECKQLFECDPTGPTNLGMQVCELDDGGFGKHEVFCEKGWYVYGPCRPCNDEVCDGLDNDCDDLVDEGTFPCTTECGDGEYVCVDGADGPCSADVPKEEICNYVDDDCDGLVDEGQTNACGDCEPIAEEVCDGLDNDCDGFVDEDLLGECSTVCEDGIEYCVDGLWHCTALPPSEEICDGLDNDCNGLVDEIDDCPCNYFNVLIPCFDPPLICGQGYFTCVCEEYEMQWTGEEKCVKSKTTECVSYCYATGVLDTSCQKEQGDLIQEVCNNWDDDCDGLTDEDLYKDCYTGPKGTKDVGICHGGQMICKGGKWGNVVDYNTEDSMPGIFVPGYCDGEVTPFEKDHCNGEDENCDGNVDEGKEMEDTDILFIIDVSGSMGIEIQAVVNAFLWFADYYSDEHVIRWALIEGPRVINNKDTLVLNKNLSPFSQFIASIGKVDTKLGGGYEMLYDALYLAIHNLLSVSEQPYKISDLWWSELFIGQSLPSLDNFKIDWREDANRVIVVFTDEAGQSYLNTGEDYTNMSVITQQVLLEAMGKADDLSVYAFTTQGVKSKTIFNSSDDGWEKLCVNGQWYELSTSASEMYEGLMQILDKEVCGEQ